MIQVALLSDGGAGEHQLLHQGLVEGNDFIQRIADLSADAEFIDRQSYRKISFPYFGENAQEFAFIELVVVSTVVFRGSFTGNLSIGMRA